MPDPHAAPISSHLRFQIVCETPIVKRDTIEKLRLTLWSATFLFAVSTCIFSLISISEG